MRVDQLETAAKLAERRRRAEEMLVIVRDKPNDAESAVLYMNERHRVYVPALLAERLLEHLIARLTHDLRSMGVGD